MACGSLGLRVILASYKIKRYGKHLLNVSFNTYSHVASIITITTANIQLPTYMVCAEVVHLGPQWSANTSH